MRRLMLLLLLLSPLFLQAQTDSLPKIGDLDWATLLDRIDTFYYHQQFQEALPYAEKMLKVAEQTYSVGHENHIESVHYLGVIWRELGEYEKALPLFEKTVQLTTQYLPKDHVRYPVFLSWLPELYTELGQYDAALEYYQKALQYAETELGKDSEFYIANLGDIAIVHSYIGNYDKAIELAEQALEITKKTTGKNSQDYIIRQSTLAQIYDEKGAYQAAEKSYQEAINLAGKILGKTHPDYSYNLNNLAILYYRQGKYQAAIPLFKEDLAITEQLVGTAHPDYLAALNNVGALYYKTGQYEKTLPIFQQIVALSAQSLGTAHPKFLSIQSNLASLYYQMGQYDAALPIYLDILVKDKKTVEANPNYAKWLNNVAVMYKTLGQTEKAILYQKQALLLSKKTYGEQHLEYVRRLDNLGKLYVQTGNPTEAMPFLEKALDILQQTKQQTTTEYIEVIFDLGDCQLALNNLATAIPYLEEAATRTKEKFGEKHPKYCLILDALGAYYTKKGVSQEAENKLHQSLTITAGILGKNHPQYGNRLQQLALFYQNIGKTERAVQFFAAASKNFRYQLHNYYPALSEGERLQFLRTVTPQIHQLFSFATQTSGLNETVQNLYLGFKGLALESSIDAKKVIENSSDSLLIETYYTWQKAKRAVAKAYTQTTKVNVDSLQKIAQQLEGKLSRQSKLLANTTTEVTVFQDLQQKITATEVVIDFLHFPYYQGTELTDSVLYYALITSKEATQPQLVRLAKSKTIQKIMRARVRASGNNYIVNPTISHDLYQTIWQPILPYLDKVTSIHLSPSGLLHQVAFEALRTKNANDDYLLNQYDLNYYSNLRDFANRQEIARTANPSIVLVGGARYDLDSVALAKLAKRKLTLKNIPTSPNILVTTPAKTDTALRGNLKFPYLPGTLQEVQRIEKAFLQRNWQTKLYTEENALEETVLGLTGGKAPTILHLATHGYFFAKPKNNNENASNLRLKLQAATNPLFRSGLVFSGVNYAWKLGKFIEGLEDGALTAYEIANLDLSQTNLVVLSACQTGLGAIHSAEGVFGLQRAFKVAGTKQLIISLWKVSDAATQQFMELFYHNYLAINDVQKAFRQAQLKLSQELPPFYWAAFVLVQ